MTYMRLASKVRSYQHGSSTLLLSPCLVVITESVYMDDDVKKPMANEAHFSALVDAAIGTVRFASRPKRSPPSSL